MHVRRGMMGPKKIVVTGGPGAGKTALLEVARRDLCAHVDVLPEAARIVFGGGFPRRLDEAARRGAQRAIYHVQTELETIGSDRPHVETLLCDRGRLDALAYWPGAWEEFFHELGTSLEAELDRYAAVIHLEVPTNGNGYTKDAVRIESEREAHAIDARLLEVWSRHPRRFVIESSPDFVEKAQRSLVVLREQLTCCATKARH
ncbi:MAG: ATP-binding protein [Deltaproteobacteria bacterium]|nr:ATP-binding protein [Deltaproteobacteria bacterium]